MQTIWELVTTIAGPFYVSVLTVLGALIAGFKYVKTFWRWLCAPLHRVRELRTRHDALVAENAALITRNKELISENAELVQRNQQLVSENVALSEEKIALKKGLDNELGHHIPRAFSI